MKEPEVGDLVSVKLPEWPGVWRVHKVDRVNVILRPARDNPAVRNLRCNKELLVPPGETPRVYETVLFDPGEIVQIATTKHAEQLYVVIADRGAHKVNVAKLGGNGGAYYRVARGGLVKVDAAKVLRNDYQQIGAGK